MKIMLCICKVKQKREGSGRQGQCWKHSASVISMDATLLADFLEAMKTKEVNVNAEPT